MKIKNVDTLFHGTRKLSNLLSIINNGFYASYADEIFANRNIKILMVSFSNIPLIEARNQVNYGDYFIGLKRSWGLEKRLHPVAYSYEESVYENNINYIEQEALFGARIMQIRQVKNDSIQLESNPDYFEYIAKLASQELSLETILILKELFTNLYSKANDIQLYYKHYSTVDKKGKVRFAYNDREWRFIPDIFDVTKLIFESSYKKDYFNPEYSKYAELKKPHFKENPLLFNLNDINYIVVKKKEDIRKVIQTLNRKFSEKAVYENLLQGELSILPMDKIWNDL
ncbi:MAG: abortive infection system antitoxin AbiGi family protein [Bacteroidota bacterium]